MRHLLHVWKTSGTLKVIFTKTWTTGPTHDGVGGSLLALLLRRRRGGDIDYLRRRSTGRGLGRIGVTATPWLAGDASSRLTFLLDRRLLRPAVDNSKRRTGSWLLRFRYRLCVHLDLRRCLRRPSHPDCRSLAPTRCGNDSPSDVVWDPARLGPTSVPRSILTGRGSGGGLGALRFLGLLGCRCNCLRRGRGHLRLRRGHSIYLRLRRQRRESPTGRGTRSRALTHRRQTGQRYKRQVINLTTKYPRARRQPRVPTTFPIDGCKPSRAWSAHGLATTCSAPDQSIRC